MKYIVKLVAIREPTLNEVLLRSDGRMDGQGERISPDMEEAYEKFVKGSAVGKNIFADIGRALSLYGDSSYAACSACIFSACMPFVPRQCFIRK